MSSTSNPNGYIGIVFTYAGSDLGSYSEFLSQFFLTLPGGGGVDLGNKQYYGYASGSGSTLQLGSSYALSAAATSIVQLLPRSTPAGSYPKLLTAFQSWAAKQAASPGQTSYANLYLSQYTGGRVYLSNGKLGLGSSGEPVPSAPSDPAYDLIYGIFEPYIAAQIGSPTIPGNLADISDIDWFSFPVTLKTWTYDFSDANADTLSEGSALNGGDGSNIYNDLLDPGSATSPTNQYPNASLPANGGSTTARRLVGPPMAAAAPSYYVDPASDPFPYHYFDQYLTYLQQAQGSDAALLTLAGTFAGIGSNPTDPNIMRQAFSFALDFSNIKTQSCVYPGGIVTKITPGSTIVFTGYTDQFGSAAAPFTITLPWFMGIPTYSLLSSSTVSVAEDAFTQGWLSQPATMPTAAGGTYSPIAATALDSKQQPIAPLNQGVTNTQLIYSVNTNPLAGAAALDDLYQSGAGTTLTISGLSGLSATADATYTQGCDQNAAVILTIRTNAQGQIDSITINDLGTAPLVSAGNSWSIASAATGLGNNQPLTIVLKADPPLRNVFVLQSASYLQAPASLSLTPTGGTAFVVDVNSAGLAPTQLKPDSDWTTLSQPAGIYGANSGYEIAGIAGANSGDNGDVKSLQNDVFGWVVADLLAALNTGLVGAPVTDPATGKSIGDSPEQWFVLGNNPYTQGLWGGAAWSGQTGPNGQPIDSFWNTWAYALYNVAGGTDAYGFAFSDRFEEGILVSFDPPPANPSAVSTVLLEVIVGDSPLFKSAV